MSPFLCKSGDNTGDPLLSTSLAHNRHVLYNLTRYNLPELPVTAQVATVSTDEITVSSVTSPQVLAQDQSPTQPPQQVPEKPLQISSPVHISEALLRAVQLLVLKLKKTIS